MWFSVCECSVLRRTQESWESGSTWEFTITVGVKHAGESAWLQQHKEFRDYRASSKQTQGMRLHSDCPVPRFKEWVSFLSCPGMQKLRPLLPALQLLRQSGSLIPKNWTWGLAAATAWLFMPSNFQTICTSVHSPLSHDGTAGVFCLPPGQNSIYHRLNCTMLGIMNLSWAQLIWI